MSEQASESTQAKIEKRFYSPIEVAKVLGVSRTLVYEMISAGELPAAKLGNERNAALRLPRSAIDALEQKAFAAASARAETPAQE